MLGWSSTQAVIEKRSPTLGELVRGTDSGRARYWQGELDELGDALMADVQPLADAFIVREGGEGGGQPSEAPAALAWVGAGPAGVETQGHYDTQHTHFAQIIGRKRFSLWPPSCHHELRLFPTHHPLHRHSSLRAPAADAPTAPLVAELSPGGLLFVPPYWLHHVEALDNLSASVSITSVSAESRRAAALEELPLPWEAEWAESERCLAAAQFVRRVLTQVYGSAGEAQARVRAQLASRFGHLAALPTQRQGGLVGEDGDPLHEWCGPAASSESRRRADAHVSRGEHSDA